MMITGKLEKFTGGPTPSAHDRLHITINRGGMIRLNMNAWRLIGKPPAVYLFYSREDHIIGIEPVHSFHMPTAFPLKEISNGRRIQASPFCKHFGIRIDTTERFVRPELSNDGKLLLLKLTETVTVKQVRRRGNGKRRAETRR